MLSYTLSVVSFNFQTVHRSSSFKNLRFNFWVLFGCLLLHPVVVTLPQWQLMRCCFCSPVYILRY